MENIVIKKNTSILKTFLFNGHRNYSSDFGWWDQMSTLLGEQTTFNKVAEYNHLFERSVKVTEYNDYHGSTSISGYVVCNSRKDARKLLAAFEEDEFPEVPYDGRRL